jgi:hypothetical protein
MGVQNGGSKSGSQTLPTTFPFSRSMDSPGQTVLLKSEMDLGRLAPASEVAEGHTLPF